MWTRIHPNRSVDTLITNLILVGVLFATILELANRLGWNSLSSHPMLEGLAVMLAAIVCSYFITDLKRR